MKLRKCSLLFLATVLFCFTTISVEASPKGQDPQDALIRQVLTATATELGWSASVNSAISESGIPEWFVYHTVNNNIFTTDMVQISAFSSTDAAKNALQQTVLGEPGQWFEFHGHSAFFTIGGEANATGTLLQVDRFHFVTVVLSGESAKNYLETCYRNAVANGLIAGESGFITPAITGTVAPATVTPGPGTSITLKAYAENYGEVIDAIDNSANFGSVSISGRVTSLDNGAAIGGATIAIVSGAASGSTQSAADGSYTLTASVPGGQDNGAISGIDFALPVRADLTITVIPNLTEILADGKSTSDITIEVKDLQGNPLKDRTFSLEPGADAGPGTIQPAQASTDENGILHATYTAFQLAPGPVISNGRHEVTISARDNTTGLAGSASIFVNQYQLSILFDEYIPACIQCNFPSKITVFVSDYWNNPIPNVPLSLRIEGASTDGTLVADPNSNQSQQEIALTADNNGRATVFFKWQGSLDITEAVRQVVIVEGITNAQATRDVQVHGLDIGIGRIKEVVGFTGVTGQQAFLKVYFKELAHPDLPLDRFNVNYPNKLSLRVTISQYHSDGVNTSQTYENSGGWEQDGDGFYVNMYSTPHMPYIIPMNDGSSWYEIRVDPVIDQDVYLPDLFRANNDTILALTTGSPDGWLHIWLQEGILTPQNWWGVLFKCTGRFLPGISQAMTVIDTLNQAYNQDVLGLGQSTAQVLTDALEAKSVLTSPELLKKYNLTKAAALNNIVSCLQDSYLLYKQSNKQSSSRPAGFCTISLSSLQTPIHFPAMDGNEAGVISNIQDRFVQGMLLDSPDQRGVVVYGLDASHVSMHDGSGAALQDSDLTSLEGNMAVFILPVDSQFQLEVTSDQAFSIGVYEAGDDDTHRKTFRHEVQTVTNLTASMAIGGTSNYALKLDYEDEGVPDTTLMAQATTLDVVKPQITSLQPEAGDMLSSGKAVILASYADNPGGTGIDTQAINILVDDIDLTTSANVQPGSLSLSLPDLEAGEHTFRLVVSDLDGNATVAERTFTVRGGFSFSSSNTILFLAVGGGVFLIFLLGIVLAISILRKQPSPKTKYLQGTSPGMGQAGIVQDPQGNWWYQDPGTGGWSYWNGQAWQPVHGAPPSSSAPQQVFAKKPGGWTSCLLSLLTSAGIGLLVGGGMSLVIFNFLPGIRIELGSGDPIQSLAMGGGGLLATILGLLLLNGGFRAILTRRTFVVDEWNRRHEKRGCGAILTGLGQLLFGGACLAGGVGLMTLAFFQIILPWLGS